MSNSGHCYLPTRDNTSKEPFLSLPPIKDMPNSILTLLLLSKPVKLSSGSKIKSIATNLPNLAPQLVRFCIVKKVIPSLFKIITPNDFRDIPEYAKGYLEPKDVPEGRGSEYLSKVSAILGSDISVNIELYGNTMEVVNNLFSLPMKKRRLQETITDPMTEERAKINNKPIWQYDENWEDNKLNVVTKRNAQLEAFFDDKRSNHYLVDIPESSYKSFSRDNDFMSYIDNISLVKMNKAIIQSKLPLVQVTSTPKTPFGYYQDKEITMFNLFNPSKFLQVFQNPNAYKNNYKRPKIILQYLESLIPDLYMRNYLLKFLKRKLSKFEYSPVVLYFLGVSGAGKDVFVTMLEKILGDTSISRPAAAEFIAMYNGWMLDKYFVQLDEYGNQLLSYDKKELALGLLKSYTGKNKVQIRLMRTDGFNDYHNVTFILTSNKNPFGLDQDDRRIALFSCPNDLKKQLWVRELGGVSKIIDALCNTELLDFCYYLSVEVDDMSKEEFMQPPETQDKRNLILNSFGAGYKLTYIFNNHMWEELQELCIEHNCEGLLASTAENRIYEEELFDLYTRMTDGCGKKRGLAVALKDFSKIPTTKNRQKAYYYVIPELSSFIPKVVFDSIENQEPEPKSLIRL